MTFLRAQNSIRRSTEIRKDGGKEQETEKKKSTVGSGQKSIQLIVRNSPKVNP